MSGFLCEQHIFEQQCRGHLRDYCRQITRAFSVKVVVILTI